MGDVLSQAEIDALLSKTATESNGAGNLFPDEDLTPQEIDALGEIGNICMGTSATTLYALLRQKVTITTPKVTLTNWDELAKEHPIPYVAVKVRYISGLDGVNLLILKEDDVKIIADLMMGGEGKNVGEELTEFHLSAISEAMNQMIGSAATSMSSMFNKRIEISPPNSFMILFKDERPFADMDESAKIVKIAFKMVIGDLVDSEIMQLLPIGFAKSLVENLLNIDMSDPYMNVAAPKNGREDNSYAPKSLPEKKDATRKEISEDKKLYNNAETEHESDDDGLWQEKRNQAGSRAPVNVHPAHFEAFDEGKIMVEKKNINLIMDVPLQVTVELGRTTKLIKDILEFSPGSIIELDKLAGEPVDILVNGKSIAKGEVVVIDESFGVRITDIIHPSKRL